MTDSLVTGLVSLPSKERWVKASARRVLVISAANGLSLDRSKLAEFQPIYTLFSLLDRRLLDDLRPAAVVAPLIADSFDVLDVALFLASVGFDGSLYVHSRPLPRADLVMGEIRSLCPGMTISLLSPA